MCFGVMVVVYNSDTYMKQNSSSLLQSASLYIFYGLLAYMPVHIFFSTWIGTSFGVLEIARVAKEGVVAVGATLALIAALRAGIVRKLLTDKLVWLIMAFTLLNIALALVRKTDQDAELLGLVYNVRFLILFVWAVLLAKLYGSREILRRAVQIVLAVGALTVLFGLIQYTVLPDTALAHVGYRRATGVLPAFFIDDKPDLERIMSTVRDPNSFGSYLLIILGLTAVRALAMKEGRKKMAYMIFSALTLLAIFWTFSRAAWIGAVVTLAVVALFVAARQKIRLRVYKVSVGFALALMVVGSLTGLYVFKDSYLIKNVVIHADESTVMENPNELRIRFWRESVEDIAAEPLGSGPGTAGLASIRNKKRTVLNENYYLQIAQEVGIIGIVLFLGILGIVAFRLWGRAGGQDLFAAALLAGLTGLLVTNFLAHIWANEAVAYTWWGLAGLTLALPRKKSPKSA
jgi:putative inorganic carbon (hco3(-)) transporter